MTRFPQWIYQFSVASKIIVSSEILTENVIEELFFVVSCERRLASEHFEAKHAERPPVHRLSIRFVLYYFRSNVIRRSANWTIKKDAKI